jgi:dihydrofolate reductase
MATVYFTASSLDGYVADGDNSLDWLTSREIDANGPFGYEAFNVSVGALVEAAGEEDVRVVGGGDAAAQFVAAGLVDEMIVSYAPCGLGSGAPVLPLRSEWMLAETGVNGEFVCARWQVRR